MSDYQGYGLEAEPWQAWTSPDGSIILAPLDPGRRKRVRLTEPFEVLTHPAHIDTKGRAHKRHARQREATAVTSAINYRDDDWDAA